jgi:hypothetical protein
VLWHLCMVFKAKEPEGGCEAPWDPVFFPWARPDPRSAAWICLWNLEALEGAGRG